MDIYREIYEGLGAVSAAGLDFTHRAFEMLPELETPRILDVGCGQGRATLELARLSGGQVVGLDVDHAALDVLSTEIRAGFVSEARPLVRIGLCRHAAE